LPRGYALKTPVSVAVWREGREYVADAADLNLHAFGPDEEAALTNLRERIVRHFERLEELGDRLASRLVTERNRLRDLLVAVDA
jgi:hypothetical protein